MPFARSGEVELYYEDDVEGVPVLLLHGHTLDLAVWDWLVPHLRAARARLVRADLRGHGRSSRPARGYRWADHAVDMVAVLDAAGVERAAVVGLSLGGGVALELALGWPDRVTSLALLSPVLPDRPWEPALLANLREVARTARSNGIAAAMLGPWLAGPVWGGSVDHPQVRRKLEEILRGFPGADYLASERDRPERDRTVPERLGEVRVPTLVVVGERELLGFRTWAVEIAAAVPGARLKLLAGLGHLHLLEAPERVAELISRHLGL